MVYSVPALPNIAIRAVPEKKKKTIGGWEGKIFSTNKLALPLEKIIVN